MVPGPFKKTKAKRSCVRVRRLQMRPGEYHKVKLRTASGGSLTIRYRKTKSLMPRSCSSGESSSGEAEASSSGRGTDQISFTENSVDENQAFENLEDLLEYSQSCVSGVPAHACDAFYGGDMQPDFSSYHFWSSDDCNSSDIGSNEVLPELITADSIDIPTAVMNESFLEEQAENTCAAFEETQCYSLEQSAMLIQQLKSFSNQGNEVASTLVCMEAYEHVAGATRVWSINRADHTSLEQGRLMESCNLPFLDLPPLLDQTESSEIELLDLPPLLRYETADTICVQEHASENVARSCVEFKEDEELFDENSFLLLDPGMPDEVNFNMSFGVPQSPWSALLENTLQEVAEAEAVQEQLTAAKEAGPRHVKETKFADQLISIKQNTWEDIPNRHEVDAPTASESIDQESSILSDPVATRGKKLRKKRLRRATPLNTLRSLLSSRDEFQLPIQHQRRIPWSALETNSQVNSMSSTINVFFRTRRKDINNCKPLSTAVHEQDFCDDTLCSEVTKRSHDISPARRFVESSMISQLDSANASKGRIAHPERVSSWRFNDPHQVYRSVHEIHNSLSHNSRMHPCTSSEDDMVNQASVIASPQRSYQESGIAPSKRNYQGSGKIARRSDGRGRPRYSALLPERAVATLRKWFDDHIAFPFADKEEKLDLVSKTGLTLTQVENWLSNYRHRLKVRRSDYEGNVFRQGTALNRQLP